MRRGRFSRGGSGAGRGKRAPIRFLPAEAAGGARLDTGNS